MSAPGTVVRIRGGFRVAVRTGRGLDRRSELLAPAFDCLGINTAFGKSAFHACRPADESLDRDAGSARQVIVLALDDETAIYDVDAAPLGLDEHDDFPDLVANRHRGLRGW
jgi:hypothetical protein